MAAKTQFPEAKVVNYDEAYKILEQAQPGEISAILTDLHFKVEVNRIIPSAGFYYPENLEAIGKQLPFGLAFVLKGIELQTPVVLYSDTDHHSDLVTGLMDMFGRNDQISDPKFLLLRDGGCEMAKDMYWDGKGIVCEELPSCAGGSHEIWEQYHEKMKGKEKVKDWRHALNQLSELTQKSAPA